MSGGPPGESDRPVRPESPDDPLGADWRALTEPEDRPRRGRALVAAATVPWVVLAVVLLRPGFLTRTRSAGVAGEAEPTVAQDARQPSAPTTDLGPGGRGRRTPGPARPGEADPAGRSDARSSGTATDEASAGEAVRFGSRVSVGPGEAAAVAVPVARAWLSDVGPNLDTSVGTAATGAYVDHLVVEEVDHPGPGAAVVSVVAVLLQADQDTYRRARVVRVAVPVLVDARGARPAGSPWWLPAPDLTPEPPPWTPVEDPGALVAAGEAVTAAGYGQVSVRSLERSPFWALRVTVDAIAPGSEAPSAHQLWLREHLGRLVVSGWRPDAVPPAENPPPPPSGAGPSSPRPPLVTPSSPDAPSPSSRRS